MVYANTFEFIHGSGRHAVVVGAGIGGLLAGHVLSGYFDRVTLVERDRPVAGGEPSAGRRGVPQGRHLHSLATRGGEVLERYFPGLDDELAAAGGPLVDQARDVVTDTPAGRLPRFESGVTMRAVSRSLLEERIRHRVAEDPKIRSLEGFEVVGLVTDDGSVTGARVRRRDEKGAAEEVLEADLVVDASGQGSRAPRWLEELGYDAPEEEVVDARLGYATRWFKVPEDFDGDWTGIAVLPAWPDNPRGGTMRRVEGGLWTAVLTGLGGDYPPTEEEAFMEFAGTLPSPAIYEAIRDAEPVSPVYGYRRTANRRRRYDKVRLPERFLALGDAACVLNPSYGSGMTVAALSVEALEECLRERAGRLTGLGRQFHKRQVRAVAPAWTTTTSSDRLWAVSSVKELGVSDRLLHRVSDEVLSLAVEREDVTKSLLEVKNLLATPSALLRPGILAPALTRTLLPARTIQEDRPEPETELPSPADQPAGQPSEHAQGRPAQSRRGDRERPSRPDRAVRETSA